MRFCYKLIIFILLVTSCTEPKTVGLIKTIPITKTRFKPKKSVSDLEKHFISQNLININTLDSNIKASLAYSTKNNFLGKIIYQDLKNCYLP